MHLIKYRFLCTMRDRVSMFWAMAFPLILGTLFYFALSNIGKDSLETIPVALVEITQSEAADTFGTFLDEMEQAEGKVIDVETVPEGKALQLLKENEVFGIFYAKDVPTLTVASEGIEESVLQTLLDSYNRNADMIGTVAKEKPEGMAAAVETMTDYQNLVKETTITGKETNGTQQYFLALVAMACLYGCFLGFSTAMNLQANQSSLAIRRCVTPTHRLKMVFVDLLVTFFVHFVNLMILLVYLVFVLKIDLGANPGGTVLVCAVGGLIGVAMGIFVGSCGKGREGVKIGIMLAISMTGSFLAGLMQAQIKHLVETNFPVLNRINPAALISDALYCISVYDDPARYIKDIVILFLMALVLGLGAFLMVRRERYDSI